MTFSMAVAYCTLCCNV